MNPSPYAADLATIATDISQAIETEIAQNDAEISHLERILAQRKKADEQRQRIAEMKLKIENQIAEESKKSIVEMVGIAFDVTVNEIFSKTRTDRVAFARQVAMSLLYSNRNLNLSLESVGHFFGKDHGTVNHAIKAVKARKETNANVKAKVEALENQTQDIGAVTPPERSEKILRVFPAAMPSTAQSSAVQRS